MTPPLPSGPRLTDEQRAPMTVSRASVALAAGAGCGKTTVLTERFVALLDGEDARSIDQIVALTFTEKAARELRDRVRIACRLRIDGGPDSRHWRRVHRGLESARIGTFHAFCGTVLRRFPIEAGIDPAFEVLDEALAPTVRAEALDLCLRRWLSSRNPDLAALAVDYGLESVKEALASFLESRPCVDLDFWANASPDEIVSRWEKHRDRQAAGPLLAGLAGDHRALLELLSREECSHAVMKARCAFLLAELPRLHEHANPRAALEELRDQARVQGGGGKANWASEEVFETVKSGLSALREKIKSIAKILEPDDGRSLRAAESGVRFARLAREAVAAYDQAKEAVGALDFGDLQARVRDLLRSGPASVREELAASIGVLLVDEFQDTDAVQSEILEVLAGTELGSGRLFLVGDAKQSIYRFRGAEPAIFDRFRSRFPAEGRLNLTENFRSVPGVLAFVNALFADAFPGAEHALKPGEVGAEPNPHPVEFHGTDVPGDVNTRRKAEAASLARMLSDRLAKGWSIRERGSATRRDARAGDVAILFRSRSDFPLYEQALASEGLDYHVVGGSTYFAQQEVIDLINLLSAIEDPLDPLALAGALRGPIFGVSDEALFWLATAGDGDLPATFQDWHRIDSSLADDDRRALGRASILLGRWRARKDHVPIARLLDEALEESGFEAALLGEFLGDRKRANVRKLVRLARKFDRRGSFTLADFVARLRADVRTPPREEQAATTDEQGLAVRLMTIHQAKGLEFPIVVLADLGRKPPNDSDLVAWEPDLGPLVRASGKDEEDGLPTWSLGRELRDATEKRAEADEALRVFYVAATRARDALILSSASSTADAATSPAMQLLSERFDLQTGECRAKLPEGWPIPSIGLLDAQASSTERNSRARFRPKILLAARRITRAAPPFEEESPRAARSPRHLDLDRCPASTTMASVREVLRAALADPEACGPGPPEEVIARACETRGLWCSSRIRDLASARLAAWRKSPVCRAVARAEEVRDGFAWTIAWPPNCPGSTVYSGRIDFACRGEGGAWNLVGIHLDEGDRARDLDLLNLRLAAVVAESREMAPVAAGWLVSIGEEAKAERVDGFDEGEIWRAIRALG